MSLTAFVAFCLGMGVEILLLFDRARASREESDSPSLIAALMRPAQLLIGVLFVAALALILIFRAAGLDTVEVYMGQPVTDAIFVGLGLFLVFYGLLDPVLLPRVSEQTVLGVHTTVLLGLLLERPALDWPRLGVLIVLTVWVFYMAAARRAFSAPLKALTYLWYLVMLFLLALQNDFTIVLDSANDAVPLAEAFIGGAAGIFLLLHSLFLIRFFLMASSLLLPLNRPYMERVIPRLFSDEPMPLGRILVLELLVVVVIVLNRGYGFAPGITVINLMVLALVQWFPAGKPKDAGGV